MSRLVICRHKPVHWFFLPGICCTFVSGKTVKKTQNQGYWETQKRVSGSYSGSPKRGRTKVNHYLVNVRRIEFRFQRLPSNFNVVLERWKMPTCTRMLIKAMHLSVKNFIIPQILLPYWQVIDIYMYYRIIASGQMGGIRNEVHGLLLFSFPGHARLAWEPIWRRTVVQ